MRSHAKRVNCQPAHKNTSASASTATLLTSRSAACGRRARRGQTSTSKCRPSWMPSIAPIMIIQMNRKRAISSVQM